MWKSSQITNLTCWRSQSGPVSPRWRRWTSTSSIRERERWSGNDDLLHLGPDGFKANRFNDERRTSFKNQCVGDCVGVVVSGVAISRISRTCASPNFNCAALACLIVSLISKFTFLTFGNFCSFTFTNLNHLNNMTFKTYENNVSTTNNKPNYIN